MISEALQSYLMIATLTVPIIATLALTLNRWRSLVMAATPLAALPAILLVVFGQTDVAVPLPWMQQHTFLQLDQVGRIFLAFTSVLWLATGWYARSYLGRDPHPVRFNVFFLLSMAGNFGLILAADIPTFYVGFAIMGMASAGLVLHRGDTESLRAGKLYLVLAMAGEVLIFSGFAFLAVSGGTTGIAELHQRVYSPTALLLLLAGFGIKAGALSLHFWLPLAHPAAPIPASAVLSGAMIKAGLLGWIRFLPLGEAEIPSFGYMLIIAGLGAAFLGTLMGVAQRNPKAVLAYSSISQMGIITTGLGIGAIQPEAWLEIQAAVLLYATHHALAKGSLFLGVGTAQAIQTRLQLFVVRIGLLLPALALAGAPFTSGALAKVALKSNLEFLPYSWALVLGIFLPLAAVGTTLKMVRFLWLTWPRALEAVKTSVRGLWLPWLSLVSATLIGVWLLPGTLGLLPIKLSPQKLWLATWPLLVGGGIAALGAWLRRRISSDPENWLPAGDIGLIFERWLDRLNVKLTKRTEAEAGRVKPELPEVESPWDQRLSALTSFLSQFEHSLRNWPVVGSLILVLMSVLIVLLASGISG
jgi:formate hydrogenlyase subunit 3/multisubunit Na+/H+ antiporter MnhD subunit